MRQREAEDWYEGKAMAEAFTRPRSDGAMRLQAARGTNRPPAISAAKMESVDRGTGSEFSVPDEYPNEKAVNALWPNVSREEYLREKQAPMSQALPKTEATVIAARHLVYKLFEATNGQQMTWYFLDQIGENPDTVSKAMELGWIVLRQGEGKVKSRERSAALTNEGRRLARKGLRG